MTDTPRIEQTGYSNTLHLELDLSFEELKDCGYKPYREVGTITFHLNDGAEIDISATQNHTLSYRSEPWDDIRHND